MSNGETFWVSLICIGVSIPAVQLATIAATSPEIANTAKEITVRISQPGSNGSGVILQYQGDIYTVLTAAHVVKNIHSNFSIATSDGKIYPILSGSIRLASADLDLAVVKFRASAKYPTAKLGNCNILTEGMDLYVAGYPSTTATITTSVFVFREGKVSANSNKIFDRGYSLVYSNNTLPGMSGGPVLNQNGELVAIHGEGDRQQNSDGELGEKTEFNLGISINRFASVATNLGVNIDREIATIPSNTLPKADDYLALGIQKYRKGDYQSALADYDRAIQLNPKYGIAYKHRGYLKEYQLNDFQGALADYNRAIQLNPNYPIIYKNRAYLKATKLNDFRGALVDYDRAIELNPSYAIAYNYRGYLKANGLIDLPGALADFDRAIELNPNYAKAYKYRGLLKYNRLADRSGGIKDIRQAARLYQIQGNQQEYLKELDLLNRWGARS